MSDWSRVGTVYVCYGHRLRGCVFQEGELWRARAYVDGDLLYQEEWLDRETAIQNCGGAMARACFARRFEKNCPTMPEPYVEDDEDDEVD